MFKNNKLFFWTIELLAMAALILILTHLSFIFKPVATLFALVFIPFLIAGFLYYVFDPLIRLMQRKFKIKRGTGIFIVFVILIGLFVFLIMTFIPSLVNQLTELINATPKAMKDVQEWVENFAKRKELKDVDIKSMFDKLNISYTDVLKNVLNGVSLSVSGVVSTIGHIGMVLVLTPILLFYMLSDGHKVLPALKKTVLKNDPYNVTGLLENLNKTMSNYIFGSAIDCTIIFTSVFIGYLIIGVPYAFLFAAFSGLCALIPYLGPYIGVLPMFLIVAVDTPIKALIAVAYVLVVCQIDGNFIYPRVVGKSMHIHPVTIMLLMLVMGNLYGLMGMIVAIPAYSVGKELVKFFVHIHEEKKKKKFSKAES